MLQQKEIEQLLLPELERLEKERQQVAQRIQRNKVSANVSSVVLALVGILVVVGFYFLELEEIFAAALVVAMLFWGSIPFIRKGILSESETLQQTFESRVKGEVFEHIFQAWNSSVRYQPRKFIPQQEFIQAQLYTGFNNYQGDDYCAGVLDDGRTFHFSELLVRHEREERKNNNTYKTYKTIFNGLFFCLEGAHIFSAVNTPSQIVPRTQDDYLALKAKSERKAPKRPSKKQNDGILDADFTVDKPEAAPKKLSQFQQLYKIKSAKKALVEQQLTPTFEEQLTYMRTTLRQMASVSFLKDKVYLTIPHRFDFWSVNPHQPLIKYQQLSHLAWNFKITLETLERLATATRVA